MANRITAPTLHRRVRPVPLTREQVESYGIKPSRLRPLHGRYVGVLMVEDDWLEMPIGDGWMAAFRLANRDGNTSILELRVFPNEETDHAWGSAPLHPSKPRKLTSAREAAGEGPPLVPREPGEWGAQIRGKRAASAGDGFSFARLRREITERSFNTALAALSEHTELQTWLMGSGSGLAGRHAGSQRQGRGAGRKGRAISFYANIAVEYDGLEYGEYDERGGGSTRAEIARRHRVSENTVAKWLQTARRLGFLTPTRQGQRGSRATVASRRLLSAVPPRK